MKKMTKKLAVVAVTMVAAISMLALAGCGNSPEQVIRDGLTQEFDTVKNLDDATLDEIAGESLAGLDEYEEFGIDIKEFLRSYLDGFDYTIGNVTVDGDTAEAEATLKIKSYSQFESDFEANINSYMEELQSDPSALANMNEEDLYAQIGPIMMDTINNVSVVETEPIIIECTKTGNTWEVADSAEQAIQDAMMNS